MQGFSSFFYESDAGPIVGSHTNDAILQASGIRSKYGAVEAKSQYNSDVSDCTFLGKCEKNKHGYKYKKGRK
jgi:hypothetical protein